MKFTEFKYSRRFNIGNYEHEEMQFTVAFDEDDRVSLDEVIERAQKVCEKNSLNKKRKDGQDV